MCVKCQSFDKSQIYVQEHSRKGIPFIAAETKLLCKMTYKADRFQTHTHTLPDTLSHVTLKPTSYSPRTLEGFVKSPLLVLKCVLNRRWQLDDHEVKWGLGDSSETEFLMRWGGGTLLIQEHCLSGGWCHKILAQNKHQAWKLSCRHSRIGAVMQNPAYDETCPLTFSLSRMGHTHTHTSLSRVQHLKLLPALSLCVLPSSPDPSASLTGNCS